MTDEETTDERPCGRVFLLARLVFGSVLAFSAIDNLRNLDEKIEYAESNNAPNPEQTVPFVSGALLFGSVGIMLWRLPRLAAISVLTFLVGVTPTMHDFWAVDEDQKEAQMVHFIKNLGLIGGALAFLVHGERDRR
ncbi:DoxX family protein [Halocatena marina]|uniref:DoxX family protein n=1 Tax=Halocatena marina TaxID=2934937 RepID=UPI002010A0F6|nr:DoxX family protein [Halocatena marina]